MILTITQLSVSFIKQVEYEVSQDPNSSVMNYRFESTPNNYYATNHVDWSTLRIWIIKIQFNSLSTES